MADLSGSIGEDIFYIRAATEEIKDSLIKIERNLYEIFLELKKTRLGVKD